MRIQRRAKEPAVSRQQMTAMIDIVFLLLVFFVMTFQVVVPEGDFRVKTETAAGKPSPMNVDHPPPEALRVELSANDDGDLAAIRLGTRKMSTLDELHRRVASLIADGQAIRVTLSCDRGLHYRHTIDAMTALRGTLGEDGTVIPLVEHIKLGRPPLRNAARQPE